MGALYVLQPRLLYQANAAGPALANLPAGEGQMLWQEADQGVRTEAWFMPGAGRDGSSPGPLVVYFHGNGEIIEQCLPQARMYTSRGISVLLPEYRGYGRSGGSPRQEAIVRDSGHWLEVACGLPGVDPGRVVFHGRSLGGGVAAALAARHRPAALVLESTFTSVAGFAWRFGAPPWLCTDPYRTDLVIGGLGCPILIMHGEDDEAIPCSHGRRLHALAPQSRYIEMAGDHNDFPRDHDSYSATVFSFLAEHGLEAGVR